MEVLPTFLFALFAVLSTVGAYFALLHWRGRKAAAIAAAATLLFYLILFAALVFILRGAGIV